MVPSEERLPGKGRLSWPRFPAEKIEAQQRVCGGITDTTPLARGGSGLLLSVTVALKKVWPHHHSEALGVAAVNLGTAQSKETEENFQKQEDSQEVGGGN